MESPALNVLYIGTRSYIEEQLPEYGIQVTHLREYVEVESYINSDQAKNITTIICDKYVTDYSFRKVLDFVRSNTITKDKTFFLVAQDISELEKNEMLLLGIDDVFDPSNLNTKDIANSIEYMEVFKTNFKLNKIESSPQKLSFKRLEDKRRLLLKRLFDIVVASLALAVLMPIMLIIALLIKLDSRGPIFYISKRAGSGYKIFNFYKFRTMKVNAEEELNKLVHMNQYANSAFVKIKNDPRVTRLGRFLRNTSLDEIPQLINVIKGDISIVGNRPLPLYEAKELTIDQKVNRFVGPAGITGLWQVTKRGKGEMSEEERIQLDIAYAENFSLRNDLKIIMKTIPALIQKEAV